MTFTVQPIPVGSRLVDSAAAQWSASDCATLKAHGVDGVIGYFESLTPQKVLNILNAGLGLSFVGYARKPMTWDPSAQMGADDAGAAITKVAALASACGFDPAGLVQSLDLEGCRGNVDQTTAYVTAFGQVTMSQGKQPGGLYVGDSQPLDGAQLYAISTINHYWKSFSRVPEVTCGWQVIQLWKSQPAPGGLPFEVDYNVAQMDWHDRQSTWLKAAA